jgi:hypothetical protein
MIEQSRGTRLLLEAAQAVVILGEGSRKYLDRDLTTESWIARPVDLSHPAGTKRRNDLVRREERARLELHGEHYGGGGVKR